MPCKITAGAAVLDAANRTITYTYTGTGKVQFGLISDSHATIVHAHDMTLAKFALYCPDDTEGTYDAPAAGNAYTGCTLTGYSYDTTERVLTFTYTGDFAAEVYSVAAILYDVMDDTAVTPLEFEAWDQVVFATPSAAAVSSISAFSAAAEITDVVASTSGGITITPTKPDGKVLCILDNNDGSNAESVTIHHGDTVQGTLDYTVSIPAGKTYGIQLESGRFIFLTHSLLKGKYYVSATADVRIQVIQLP